MRLAAITDEIDDDLDHALDVLSEYGIQAVELRTVGGKNISAITHDELLSLRALIDARGLEVVSIASPVFKTDLPDAAVGRAGIVGDMHGATAVGFEDQIDLLERCIEIARRLNAPMIRTFTFWKRGPMTPDVEDKIVDSYATAARMAEDAGVTLIVENEHACFTGTGAETARLVSRIASPAVKIVWDPGNAVYAGESPFPAGYEAVRPLLAHVHVKDVLIADAAAGALEWAVVGAGIARWPEQIAALKADGYGGFLSLETHYDGGSGKEASSRKCLDELVRLVQH